MLAMELVESAPPKERRAFDDAWHIASQVTALEHAYEKGSSTGI